MWKESSNDRELSVLCLAVFMQPKAPALMPLKSLGTSPYCGGINAGYVKAHELHRTNTASMLDRLANWWKQLVSGWGIYTV